MLGLTVPQTYIQPVPLGKLWSYGLNNDGVSSVTDLENGILGTGGVDKMWGAGLPSGHLLLQPAY